MGGSLLFFFRPMAVDVVCTQTSDLLPLYSGRMIPCDVINYFRIMLYLSFVLYFVRLQNNIHDLLVMFGKQDIPTKLQRRNRSLKYESD